MVESHRRRVLFDFTRLILFRNTNIFATCIRIVMKSDFSSAVLRVPVVTISCFLPLQCNGLEFSGTQGVVDGQKVDSVVVTFEIALNYKQEIYRNVC